MCFSFKFVIFLNSASSAAALVFYLPVVCTHTNTEGKQRKARVWNILKSSEKTQWTPCTFLKSIFNTFKISIYNMQIIYTHAHIWLAKIVNAKYTQQQRWIKLISDSVSINNYFKGIYTLIIYVEKNPTYKIYIWRYTYT